MNTLFVKKKNMTFEKWQNLIFLFLHFLIVIGVLAIIGISIWATVQTTPLSPKPKVIDPDPNSTFAVILAGITIILASSIIVPKVLLKNEVEASVANMKDKLKKEFRDEELPKFLTETLVLDGHLSRMIGLMLLKINDLNDPAERMYNVIWSLGWSIRSYKKYIKASQGEVLTGEDVSLENYHDLIMVIRDNSKDAKELLFSGLEKTRSVSSFQKMMLGGKLEKDIVERNLGLFYRTIKETLDVEYEVNVLWRDKKFKPKIIKTTEDDIKEWLIIVMPVIALLIASIDSYLKEKLKSGSKATSESKAKKELLKEVAKRSNFSKSADFNDKLSTSLDEILKKFNGNTCSINEIKSTKHFFIEQ